MAPDWIGLTTEASRSVFTDAVTEETEETSPTVSSSGEIFMTGDEAINEVYSWCSRKDDHWRTLTNWTFASRVKILHTASRSIGTAVCGITHHSYDLKIFGTNLWSENWSTSSSTSRHRLWKTKYEIWSDKIRRFSF